MKLLFCVGHSVRNCILVLESVFFFLILLRVKISGTSLMVQWLILYIPNAGGMGSIAGQRTKIPYAEGEAKKRKGLKLLWTVCILNG